MVEGHSGRRIGHHRPGPARSRPMADFGHASFDVAGRGQDDATEPAGKGAAIIRHPPVVGAVHRGFERDIVARRPGAEPARRQGQVHVDAFEIHVADPLGRVVVDARRGRRPVRAGESSHIARGRGVGGSAAEPALISAPAPQIGRLAGSRMRVLPLLPPGQPRPFRRRQIGVEDSMNGPTWVSESKILKPSRAIADPSALRVYLPRYLARAAAEK